MSASSTPTKASGTGDRKAAAVIRWNSSAFKNAYDEFRAINSKYRANIDKIYAACDKGNTDLLRSVVMHCFAIESNDALAQTLFQALDKALKGGLQTPDEDVISQMRELTLYYLQEALNAGDLVIAKDSKMMDIQVK